MVAKIRLLVFADSTSLPPPVSVLFVCVRMISVVVPVELSLIVPEFTIAPPMDITALLATLSVPAMPAPLVPVLTVNPVAALMVSEEVAARASELMVMEAGESIVNPAPMITSLVEFGSPGGFQLFGSLKCVLLPPTQ